MCRVGILPFQSHIVAEVIHISWNILLQWWNMFGMFDQDLACSKGSRSGDKSSDGKPIQFNQSRRAKPKFSRGNRMINHLKHAIGLPETIRRFFLYSLLAG